MKNTAIKPVAGVAYAAMVAVNVLANALPINNRSTGAIANAYPNAFAPAGLTFSIWGLIYLLLGGYVLYQFMSLEKEGEHKKEGLLKKVNALFIATSLANISWIFAWHYDFIGLSVLIMAVLLILLIKIADILRVEQLTARENLFISTPFSVYFGWITVAAIANITVFLVSIGWNGFGIADFVWTSIVLLAGALIGVLRMRKDKNTVYGLVLIWAYLGILLKHLSAAGFGGQYPSVIITVIACLALFGFVVARIYCKKLQGGVAMDLMKYFQGTKGLGVLSTADEKGKINAAVYSKPQVIDDTHVAFIMGDKLTHANIKQNPSAVFLFKEDGPGFAGKRIYLKKESETDNMDIIGKICDREYSGVYCEPHYLKNSFLVTFSVESVLPLVGENKP